MKTKEELNKIKEEVAALNKKLAELSEEELKQVTGGIATVSLGRGYTAEYLSDGSERIRVLNSNTHKFIIFNNAQEYEAWFFGGGISELESDN